MGTPILEYSPGGGVPIWVGPPPTIPPTSPGSGISDTGITPLVIGQSYIDVVFNTPQANTYWVLVDDSVVNTLDVSPLNIWGGIITSRTTTGFRLQLNGLPDSGNYILEWAIAAGTAPSIPAATTYSFSGPTTGAVGAPKTYIVALPTGTSVSAPVTVTPSDLGGGGTFSPTTVVLTSAAPSATFTYTPGTVGTKTLNVTNDGGLTDPMNVTFTATAFSTTYSLVGGLFGPISQPETFTVSLPLGGSVSAPVTITPSDGGAGGTFTPTSVILTTAVPSVNFTYTPSTYGARTLSTTNSGGLIDPAPIIFTPVSSTYTLTGPSSGVVSTPSTNFTVALPVGGAVIGTVTVTPSDSSLGGVFTPATVNLTTAAPSATFTYTPATTGARTIGVTNSAGLTNPAGLTYTVGAALVQHLLNTLISYWKMDESSPGSTSPVTRNDSQGTNNLTDNNDAASAAGIINNGVALVSANNRSLAVASNATLQVTGSFTFSCWVNLTAQGGGDVVVFCKDSVASGTRDYWLNYATGGGGFYCAVNAAAAYVPVGSNTANGVWTHIVWWYDSGTQKVSLRINDTTTFISVGTSALVQSTSPFAVGARSGAPPGYIDAVVDELGFWKRLLTANEITFLYNGGAGNPFSSFLA